MASSNAHAQRSSEESQNLHNAIDSATPERVRALLKHLSTTSPANFAYVQGELMLRPGALKRARSEEQDEEDDFTESDYSDTESDCSDTESDYSDEQTDALVRRQRFDICKQCGEEYDVLHNKKKSCQWHEGELEVDDESDFWADNDERYHGMIDTPEMRELRPEGFVWTCCDELGTEPGCRQTRHQPNRAKRVKR